MASRKTSPPKPSKVVKPRPAKDVVNDLRTGIEDLRAIDPEHPWAKLLKEAVAAIREQQRMLDRATAVAHEQLDINRNAPAQLATALQGELEQVKAHLVRFLHEGRNDLGRDERIEAQLAGINEWLRERSREGRVFRHGKVITAEELSRELDAVEREKNGEIIALRGEVDRFRAALQTALQKMAVDPVDRRPMPPPQRSWRTAAAESVTAAPLD